MFGKIDLRVGCAVDDRIRLSVSRREIALLVSDAELAQRALEQPVVAPTAERGYRKLFLQSVTQADRGVDFDFLQTAHNEWASAPITVSQVTMSYSKTPPRPVVNGEVTYEWHKNQSRHDLQRFMFWTCMLNGAELISSRKTK